MSQWTIGEVLDAVAEVVPDRPMTVCGDRVSTYAQSADRAPEPQCAQAQPGYTPSPAPATSPAASPVASGPPSAAPSIAAPPSPSKAP